ncbi:LacI family DNA-binding transcriptional regulator [Trueperella sp. LYQ143]|uniref:LacI family DNA-binding transcriptional regulator n=1 Tax=unclassified Trueperella TaxID=2630174 RepID=UPI0039832605
MARKKVTLTEVAAYAGVSLGSASRAMRGNGASGATARKVLEAAEELGYVPNLRARALREGKTMTIAFAVPDIGNPAYVEMMKELTNVLSPVGYRVTVAQIGSDPRDAIDFVRSFANGSVDAAILSVLRISDELVEALKKSEIPVVVIGSPVDDGDIETITTDSALGIGMAVRHVVDRGCKDLIFVNGPLDTRPGAARQMGFDDIVEQLGSEISSARTIRVGDFNLEAGSHAGRRIARLWEDKPASDVKRAVIAANDLLAIGVMRELMSAGFLIPRDVAVTGMDAIELGKLVTPTLTSVSLRAGERGRLAAESLLSHFDTPTKVARSTFLEPQLIIAESTGWM